MADVLLKMFGTSAKVLVKDGTFNNVEGEYHHHDYSQHIVNNGSYNFIGNTLQNVHNSGHQVIHQGRNTRHGPSANGREVTADARAIDNYAHTEPASSSFLPGNIGALQSQAPGLVQDNYPAVYGANLSMSFPHRPGQYLQARPGDIRPMTAVELEFLKHQMAEMHQEMISEFPDSSDNTEEETATESRSQSLSADLQRLSICEPVSQSSSQSLTISRRTSQSFGLNSQYQVESYTQLSMLGQHNTSLNAMATKVIRGMTTTQASTVKAGESARHIIIYGDHTEVDNRVHEFNLNSHNVANNIIENSFGEGEEEVIEQVDISKVRKSKQGHVRRRNVEV